MAAGAFDVVVIDLFIEQLLVEATIDREEEIFDSAIDDEPEVMILQVVDKGDHGILIPIVFVFGDGSEILFDAPVVGEGTKVDTAAGRASCAVGVFVS